MHEQGNAHSTRCIGHGPDDFCGCRDPCGQLGNGNTRKDTDEQLSVKSFAHSILAEDGLRLVGFGAVRV